MNRSTPTAGRVLVHLGAGIGNIVLATPLLVALREMDLETDLALAADYHQTRTLLEPWAFVRRIFHHTETPPAEDYAHVLPALPPFYWPRFARQFRHQANLVTRPPDALFYEDEQRYYLQFAVQLGYPSDRQPACMLPVAPNAAFKVTADTLVIAPGCKTGLMAAKRWPHYPELARRFSDVVLVGTSDDLQPKPGGQAPAFPPHVRSFIDRLSLRQTAEAMACAAAVVGNDSGLSHVASAIGTPTICLFGPTSDRVLGRLPPNTQILRRGLPCEPCWQRARFQHCAFRIDCLAELPVEAVVEAIRYLCPHLG
jgi:ADP-heptose:LPS heptosyltransferase